MKKLLRIAHLAIFACLSSCTCCPPVSHTVAANSNKHDLKVATKEIYSSKNPETIALFTKAPHRAYRVIGIATISKYNFLGMERNPDTLHTMMKKLAASMGGDAIIDVNDTKDAIQANVIAFQRILL